MTEDDEKVTITLVPTFDATLKEAMARVVRTTERISYEEQGDLGFISYEPSFNDLTIYTGGWPWRKRVVEARNIGRMFYTDSKAEVTCYDERFERMAAAIAKVLKIDEVSIDYFKTKEEK